jgi:ubiquinone/menaquinone biosynthesis C-methylase UbiE
MIANIGNELPWTGERYLPNIGGDIALEHLHRYEVAANFAHGKSVLDIACGEGYGSQMLSRFATKVMGVDISEEAITHATKKYASGNLEYKIGSCLKIPVPDSSYDLVVSFETIEHVDDHVQMMSEIKRILRPGGLLIISSPNKEIYTDAAEYHNEHHVKELYKDEFVALINTSFSFCKLLGQRIQYGSALISEESNDQFLYTKNIKNINCTESSFQTLPDPMYWLAICSNQPIQNTFSSILEQDLDSIELAVSNRLYAMENKKILDVVHSLQEQVVALQSDSDNKQANINSLQQSLSWKITYPLRVIDGIFNGNKN